MFKKFITLIIAFITLFYFYIDLVLAYDLDPSNEAGVNDMINEIYSAKEQYETLVGDYKKTVKQKAVTSSAYWWPIGSEKTTESNGRVYAADDPIDSVITSFFGYRADPFGSGKTELHPAIDISGPYAAGTVNIIAAKSGTVVYPTAKDRIDYQKGSSGYGNHVIIQHSDGNYTLYAHLHENTITVRAGDSVEQGQVIGKMGTSGSSTGTHLHFEVREGRNAYVAAVDPLKYVSLDNPREIAVDTTTVLIDCLKSWEGKGKKEGDYYIVQALGDNVLTVGSGITLEYNGNRFKKHGIDVSNYTAGSKIPIEIVNQVFSERIADDRSYVEKELAKASITLETYQVDALTIRKFNYNISGFVEAYKKYGNTEKLYDNYMSTPITYVDDYGVRRTSDGLIRRRKAEWKLFHKGIYEFNDGTEIKASEVYNSANITYPYYNQGDSQWNPVKLEDGNSYDTQSCGCGYLSIAMVASGLNNDSKITPITVIRYLHKFSSSTCAIDDTLMHSSKLKNKYGLSSNVLFDRNISQEKMKSKLVNELKKGRPVILLVPGHYILLSKIDSKGKIEVLDPGGRNNNGKYTIDQLHDKYKNYSNKCTTQNRCGFEYAISYYK